jgi:hypothetical protein
VPAEHGVWLDDDQHVRPARPDMGKDQPERAIARAQAGAARCAPQVGQLLAKGKVLECKVRAGTEGGTKGSEEAEDQGNHRPMMHDGRPIVAHGCSVIASVGKSTARMVSWRGTRKYLIIDRDPLYTREFRSAMERGGVKILRLPPSSPNLNAFAERFVLSIKSECLAKMVPLGEAHLRRTVSEYVRTAQRPPARPPHYHLERNHQGLNNELISRVEPANTNGRVARRARLGGLLNFYHREAA